jgi:hypothetical protein
LSRKKQSDEYYKGASGSPIGNPEGSINSILIGGGQNDLLLAFRLDSIDIKSLIVEAETALNNIEN